MSVIRDKWLALMQGLFITDDLDTMSDERRWRMIKVNAAISVFFVMHSVRLGCPEMFGRLPCYVYGNTLVNTGNIKHLIMLLAIVALLQMAMYRLLVLLFLRSRDMRLVSVLRSIGSDHELRNKKLKLAQLVYDSVIISTCIYLMYGLSIETGILYLNLLNTS